MTHHRFGPFWWYRSEACWLFGVGRFRIGIQDRRVRRALFSERNGLVRVLRVGPYAVRLFTGPMS